MFAFGPLSVLSDTSRENITHMFQPPAPVTGQTLASYAGILSPALLTNMDNTFGGNALALKLWTAPEEAPLGGNRV